MKDFQLVIPTHARPLRQITLEQLPSDLQQEVLLVTSTKDDASIIRANYGRQLNIVVASGVRSIAEKRHWIMRNVDARAIFMMDDDMTFFTRCSAKYRVYNNGWKLRDGAPAGMYFLNKSTAADLRAAFLDIQERFQEHAAVGMSSRMGNNTSEPAWEYNTRLMHAFGLLRETYLREKLDFREVPIREDMNVALHLLRRGYSNALMMYTCCSPGSYGAAGGASTERSMDQSNVMAEKLALVHKGFVRVVDKAYQSSIPRKEVVVSWKKAFASSGATL